MTKPFALIIEDDRQLSEIFSFTLSGAFDTEKIMDGAEALSRLAEATPQLIVLDINLPGVSGAHILNFVRADSRFASTRVILATANPLQAEELQDMADVVLLKPISPSQLRDLAARLV